MSSLGRSQLETRQLSEQVCEHLKQWIITGELVPGQRLAIRELARDMGVSFTPVRDAINRLASEGLVIVRPRSGACVARFDANDIDELYQIRLMIEPEVARQTAATVSDEWLEHARKYVTPLEERRDEVYGDYDLFQKAIERDSRLHLHLVAASGNRRLIQIYRGLNAHWRVARQLFRRRAPVLATSHQDILDCYARRDSEAAAETVRRHLLEAREVYIRLTETEAKES